MSWLTLVLRVLHIGGGVFWAGSTFMFAGFVEPAVAALGSSGSGFVERLVKSYSPAMAAAAVLSVGAGIWLFSIDSGGFQSAFMGSPLGVVLSIGGLCALLAGFVGFGGQARNAARLKKVASAIQGQSGGPTPEQPAQMKVLEGKLRTGGRVAALFLGITVICMAIARYV